MILLEDVILTQLTPPPSILQPRRDIHLNGLRGVIDRRKANNELAAVLDNYPKELAGIVSYREHRIGLYLEEYAGFFQDRTPDLDALSPTIQEVHDGIRDSVDIAAGRIHDHMQRANSAVKELVGRIGSPNRTDPKAERILQDYNTFQEAIKICLTPNPDNLASPALDTRVIRPDIPNLTPETRGELDKILRGASSPEAEAAIRAYLDIIVLGAVDRVFMPLPTKDIASYASTPTLKQAIPIYRDCQIFEWVVNSQGDIPNGVGSVEEGLSSSNVFRSFMKMADELWPQQPKPKTTSSRGAYSEPGYYDRDRYDDRQKPDIERIVEEAIANHPSPKRVSWLRSTPEEDIQQLIKKITKIRTNTPGISDKKIFTTLRSELETQTNHLPEEKYKQLNHMVNILWTLMGDSLDGELPF